MYRIQHFDSSSVDESIFQLRYDVYVDEMGRAQVDADHVNKRIFDELDENAYHIGAFFGNQLIGCLRCNLLSDQTVGAYEQYYKLTDLKPRERNETAIVTRFMLHPDHRHRTVLTAMLRYTYVWGLHRKIRYSIMDCNDHLIPFFKKVGYEEVRVFRHPEYGIVQCMKLDMLAIERLREIKSIYCDAYDLCGIFLPELCLEADDSIAGSREESVPRMQMA